MRAVIVMGLIMACISPFVQAKETVLNGSYKEYYADGKTKSFRQFKSGKLEGVSREYHPNGKLAFVQTVKNGKINGPVRSYDQNGVLRGEVHFVDNLEEGVLNEYYDNGKIMEKVTYIRGDIVNIKKFDRQGNLVLNQESNFPLGCKIVVQSQTEKF